MADKKVVLITGEQGFLGSRLLGQLKDTYSVFGFDGDVTDRHFCFEKLKKIKPDVVVHLAALSLPKQCDENPTLAKQVNVEGTRNIADAANDLGKPVHFVFTSTAQVYDYNELSKGYAVDEDCPIKPQNLYAETKRQCEVLLQNEEYTSHLKITVLRLFNHVHKSQQSATFMSSVYSQILEHKKQQRESGEIVVGDLELYRELNPVQSLMVLFKALCAVTPTYTYSAFNVCSGNSRKLRNVADAFATFFKMKLNFVLDEKLLRKNDPKVFVGSNQKIKTVLSLAYPQLSDLELVEYFCTDL